MSRKIDKRTLETKKKIKEAVINQLQHHQSSEITVTDIATACDINRNTFYIHYSSIADVLVDIEGELKKIITDNIAKHPINAYIENPQLLIGMVARIFITSKNYGGLIFESNFSKYLTSSIITELSNYLYQEFKKVAPESDAATFFTIEFLVGGFFYSLKDWYHNRKDVTLEELMNRMDNIIKNGVAKTLDSFLIYSRRYN